MGAHHAETAEAIRLTRVVIGRGALVASTALALTGAGAGGALATSDHDGSGHEGDHGDDHSYGHGHDDEHEYGSAEHPVCDTEGLADGLLGQLGLSEDPEQLCATDSGHDAADADGASTDDGSSDTGTTQQAADPAPTNPDDIPPAPGETKTIDLPDRPAGRA